MEGLPLGKQGQATGSPTTSKDRAGCGLGRCMLFKGLSLESSPSQPPQIPANGTQNSLWLGKFKMEMIRVSPI